MPPPDATERGATPDRPSRFAVLRGGKDGISQDAAAGVAECPTPGRRARTPVAMAFGLAAVAVVVWLLASRSEEATLRGLPATERAALVDRTLANLRDVCHGAGRPRGFCLEQARLALELPECREACQAAARAELVADSAVK
jgi:hypothetical protein